MSYDIKLQIVGPGMDLNVEVKGLTDLASLRRQLPDVLQGVLDQAGRKAASHDPASESFTVDDANAREAAGQEDGE